MLDLNHPIHYSEQKFDIFIKEIRFASPSSPFPSIKCAEFNNFAYEYSHDEIPSSNREMFLNEWHWKWFNVVRTRAIFFPLKFHVTRRYTSDQFSMFSLICDWTHPKSYFSADGFFFVFHRKRKILFDINIISSLFRAFECFARTLYNERKKCKISKVVALCQLVQSTNLFSISHRDERLQLFVNYKLFSHSNGNNEKSVEKVCGALLHFYHTRLTYIPWIWRSLLPPTISSCPIGECCYSSPFVLHHNCITYRNMRTSMCSRHCDVKLRG